MKKQNSFSAKMFVFMGAATYNAKNISARAGELLSQADITEQSIPLIERGQRLGEIRTGDPIVILLLTKQMYTKGAKRAPLAPNNSKMHTFSPGTESLPNKYIGETLVHRNMARAFLFIYRKVPCTFLRKMRCRKYTHTLGRSQFVLTAPEATFGVHAFVYKKFKVCLCINLTFHLDKMYKYGNLIID